MLHKTAQFISILFISFFAFISLNLTTQAAALTCNYVYGTTRPTAGNSVVIQYDPTGSPVLGPTATGITLNGSTRAAALSPDGRLIVYYDDLQSRIEWMDLVAGTSGFGPNLPPDNVSPPNQANRMGFTNDGRLYLVAKNNVTLKQDVLQVNTTTFATTFVGALTNSVNNPIGTIPSSNVDNLAGGDLIFDDANKGYIIDNNGSFFKFNLSTLVATYMADIPGIDSTVAPAGLAYSSAGDVYTFTSVLSGGVSQVYKIDLPSVSSAPTLFGTNPTDIFADAFGCAFPDIKPKPSGAKGFYKIVGADALGLGGTRQVVSVLSPGDIVEYEVILRNSGGTPITGSKFSDVLPAGATYVANSTTMNGSTISGASFPFAIASEVHSPGVLIPGVVNGDTTPSITTDNEVTITYRLVVDDPFSEIPRELSNQGTFTFEHEPPILTCDPNVSICGPTIIDIIDANDDAYTFSINSIDNPIAPLGNDVGNTLVITDINGTAITPGTAQTITVPNGTVNVSATGVITFTPTAGYSGSITFPYTVTDSYNQIAVADINITVNPVALDDAVVVDASSTDNPLNLLGNDQGTGLTVTEINGVAITPGTAQTITVPNGTVSVSATGVITFTPTAGYSGPITFPYEITDSNGSTSTADVNVTVNPVAVDDTVVVDASSTDNLLNLLGNDQGTGLTVTEINGVAITPGTAQTITVPNGTVNVSATGVITFTPTAGYSGPITFPYEITDSNGSTSTADVNVTVNPVAVDDAVVVDASSTDNPLDLLGNDIGTGLTVTEINGVAITPGTAQTITVPNGTVSVSATGVITFTPTAGYSGPITFPYEITDSNGSTSIADVNVTVNPVAVDDAVVVDASSTDNPLDLLGNDQGTGLTVTEINGVAITPGTAQTITVPNGTVSVSATGVITFTPTAGYSGPITFPYEITDSNGSTSTADVNVTVNPVAVDDAVVVDASSTDNPLNLLGNDQGTGLTVTEINGVAITPGTAQTITVPNGTVSVSATGVITFTPTAGYSGPITFPYEITDSNGSTSTADVNVTVNPVAVDDAVVVDASSTDNPLNLLGNDIGTGLTVTEINGVAITPGTAQTITVPNGTVSVSATGVITFTPTAGYSGPITFPYEITDSNGSTSTADVNVTVNPVAVDDAVVVDASSTDNPLNLLGNDIGTGLTVTEINGVAITPGTAQTITVPNGTVNVSATGVITFTPTAGYSGPITFPYEITDSNGSTSIADVNVTVNPVAVDDAVVVDASSTDNPLDLLGNDIGTGLTVTEINGVAITPGTAQTITVPNGTVSVSATGVITFTPTAGYSGPITFPYEITDSNGSTSIADVNVTVNPVAVDDAVVVDASSTDNPLDLLGNDIGTGLTVTEINGVAITPGTAQTITVPNGTVNVSATGVITFTPTAGYSGPITFPYEITDSNGSTSTADVNVTVNPVAVDDAVVVDASSTDNPLNLLGNDIGTGLTVTEINGVAITPGTAQTITVPNGTVSVSATGVITFTPTAGYSGPITFPYEITDSNGSTSTADVNVTVNPVAVDDAVVVDASSTDNPLNLLGNDIGTGLTVTEINGVAITPGTAQTITVPNGTVNVSATGVITFTPTAGYSGPITFPYEITDSNGSTSIADVNVTVNPVAVDDAVVVDASSTDNPLDLLGNDIGTGLTVTEINGVAITPGTAQTITVPNGTVSVSATGVITFTPTAGYSGPITFPYEITDSNGSTSIADVNVTVNPVAVDDAVVVDASSTDNPLDLLGNDIGTGLTVTEINGVAITPGTAQTITVPNGTVNVSATGVITFTPTAGYSGPITFPYEITDSNGSTSTADVNVTVNPVAVDDAETYIAGSLNNTLDLLINDVGTSLTVTEINGVTITPGTAQTITVPNGTVSVSATGVITFTPDAGYTGPITFPYTIEDSSGNVDTATVNIEIVNTPPVALDDTVVIDANGTATITPLSNDTDADAGQVLTITEINGEVLTYAPNTTQTIVVPDGVVTVVYDASGVPTITVTPDEYFTGTLTIPYTISDGNGGTDTADIIVVVENTDPVAVDDTYTTTAGDSVVLLPLLNDGDVDGHPVVITSINGVTLTPGTAQTITVTDGVVTIDASGNIVFTPTDPTFTGVVSFPYTISDGQGGTDSAEITIEVVNDAPVAVDDSATTIVGVPVTIDVVSNDTDANGDPLTVTEINGTPVVVGTPIAVTGGTVTVNADGTVTVTPDAGYTDPIVFDYTVSDPAGGTDTGTVTVTQVNDEVVANDDNVSTLSGTPVSLNLLQNDVDENGEVLSVTEINGVAITPGTAQSIPVTGGVVNVDVNGGITFVPDAGFTGTVTFPYTVSDPDGNTDTATVTVTVVNTDPVANPDGADTILDTPVTVSPLTNDYDIDGDTLTITSINGVTPVVGTPIPVTNGTATLNADGTVTVTPSAGYIGEITFPYEVSDGEGGTAASEITVTVQTDSVAASADNYVIGVGDPIVMDLLNNDVGTDLEVTSINGVALTNTPSTTQTIPVTNGTVTVVYDASGVPTITFTPDAGYTGPVTFPYTIEDSSGNVDSAVVNIEVINEVPVALDDTVVIDANGSAVVNPLGNDSDPDAGQTLTITEINGVVLTYTPSTTQTIPVTDGVVTVVYDASGVPTITVTPDEYFTGVVTVPYTISDGQGGTDSANVIVTVENTVPVANDDSYTTTSGDSVVLLPLVNDGDIDGHPVVITSINGVTLTPGIAQTIPVPDGVVTIDASGNIVFTPSDPTFTGTVSFPYTVSDGHGGTDSAVITIEVVNDAPVAVDDSVTTIVGVPVTIDVVSNDTDPNGDPLTVTEINGVPVVVGTPIAVTGGTVTVNADGTVTVTPDAGNLAPIVFDYTVSDPAGGTDTGTVTVTLVSVLVIANDDTVITPSGTPVSLNLLQNDVDENGQVLSVTEINGVAITPGTAQSIPVTGGVVNVDVNGGITFVPDAGFTGTVTFPYTVSDPDGNTDTAVVTVTVVNTDPVANPDGADTILDTPVTIDLLTNDVDVDGDTLTITEINGTPVVVGTPIVVPNGTVTVNADGSVTIIPNTNYVGQITFEYTISDGNGGTSISEVTVTVQTDSLAATVDMYELNVGEALVIDLLGNDVGIGLIITSINNVTLTNTPSTTQTIIVPNGAVNIVYDVNGNIVSITFIPEAGYTGPITFPYTIVDASGNVDSTTVNIDIMNTPPIAINDMAYVNVNSSVLLNPLVNDIDSQGQVLTITSINGVTLTYIPNTTQIINTLNGVVTVTYDSMGVPTISYKPNTDYTGVEIIAYTISDGHGGTASAQIIVNIGNDSPVAVNDTLTVVQGNTVDITPLLNDSDPDGQPITITVINGVVLTPGIAQIIPVPNGVINVSADGKITLVPNEGFVGIITFSYTIADSSGKTASAVVSVTVSAKPVIPKTGYGYNYWLIIISLCVLFLTSRLIVKEYKSL